MVQGVLRALCMLLVVSHGSRRNAAGPQDARYGVRSEENRCRVVLGALCMVRLRSNMVHRVLEALPMVRDTKRHDTGGLMRVFPMV